MCQVCILECVRSVYLDGDCALCMQILQPGNATFLTATQGLERDLEQEIYQILVKLRCAPFLKSYVATLKSEDRMGSERVMPLGLKAFNSVGGWSASFHPLNNGIDFRYSNTTLSVPLLSVLVVPVVCTVSLVIWCMHSLQHGGLQLDIVEKTTCSCTHRLRLCMLLRLQLAAHLISCSEAS